MKSFCLNFMGRFGNAAMQYLFARAYAEKFGLELRTDPWVGEQIFQIEHPRIDQTISYPKRCENTLDLVNGEGDVTYRSYSQQQKCMIYTKAQAQRWLKIRPEWTAFLEHAHPEGVYAHQRVGDYAGYEYPLVTTESYIYAAHKIWTGRQIYLVAEENAQIDSRLPSEISFLQDFYLLMTANYLLRGNSTFSWVAALLGNGEVWSPVIDGCRGGRWHDVEFEKGNHKKFHNLDFLSDLHINP